MVEGIPCSFTLEAAVESFDLVLMAENATDTGGSSAAAADPSKATAGATAAAPAAAAEAPAGEAGDGNDTDSVLISAEDAAEAVEAEAAEAAASGAAAAETSVVDEPDVERAGAEEGDAASPEVAEAGTADVEATAPVSEQTEEVQEEVFHDADGSAEPTATAAETLPTEETEPAGSEPEEEAAAAVESKAVIEEAAPMSGSAGEDIQVDANAPPAAGVVAAEEETAAAAAEAAVDGESAAGDDGSAAADSTAAATAGADDDGSSLAAALSLDTAGAETEAAEAAAAAAGAPEEERATVEEGDSESAPAVAAPESAEEVVAEAADTGDDFADAEAASPAADVASAAEALASTNGDVASASPETAAALGCSTLTIEVVVPSAELDFKLSQGQWRYLEADSTPVHGGDVVEVTKGIRFSTSLKAVDSREDDVRALWPWLERFDKSVYAPAEVAGGSVPLNFATDRARAPRGDGLRSLPPVGRITPFASQVGVLVCVYVCVFAHAFLARQVDTRQVDSRVLYRFPTHPHIYTGDAYFPPDVTGVLCGLVPRGQGAFLCVDSWRERRQRLWTRGRSNPIPIWLFRGKVPASLSSHPHPTFKMRILRVS